MERLTWHFPTGQREAPAYYLADAYDLVAVRIHAAKTPARELEVDILEDGVSIFADTAQSHAATATTRYRKDAPSTWVTLVGDDAAELDAENFRKDDIGPGWITALLGQDGGASNFTVQLEIEKVADEGEVSE
jgi:hypothetical protein